MDKNDLVSLYTVQNLSSFEISKKIGVSVSKVNYWLKKFDIPKRSISESVYRKYNKNGDPFSISVSHSSSNLFLLGLGLGLYWGEGTKSDRYAVRLGNTNPKIIKKFIQFLKTIYQINTAKLKFGLQIFNDCNEQE